MTTTGQALVIGIYEDFLTAERAMKDLYSVGFQESQVAVDARSKGTGSIMNNLLAMGMPDDEAMTYESALQAGQIVLLVIAAGRQREAIDILQRNGARDVSYSGTDRLWARIVPLREEQLHIQKQMVVSGEFRIHKRVITEEKTITVQISREVIEVEQVPLSANDHPLYASSDANTRAVTSDYSEIMRIPLREEQLFLEKRPIVVEEIIVKKRLVQAMKQITETVQKEVPHLEQHGNVNIHGNKSPDLSDQYQR